MYQGLGPTNRFFYVEYRLSLFTIPPTASRKKAGVSAALTRTCLVNFLWGAKATQPLETTDVSLVQCIIIKANAASAATVISPGLGALVSFGFLQVDLVDLADLGSPGFLQVGEDLLRQCSFSQWHWFTNCGYVPQDPS